MRATALPTVQRLIMPKPAKMREETLFARVKDKLKETVTEYVQSECNDKGWPKSNLSEIEKTGLKENKSKN